MNENGCRRVWSAEPRTRRCSKRSPQGAKRGPLLAGKPYRNRAMIADVFGQLCNRATGNFERGINRRARSLPAVGADGHECKRLLDAHPSQANGPREVAAGIGGQDDLRGGYEPATANAVRASTPEGKKRPLRVIPAMFGSWVRSSLNRAIASHDDAITMVMR